MGEDAFKDRLVHEFKEYFPNDSSLQNFCTTIILMRDNPDYALTDGDRDILRNSIKDLSVFTSLGIYTKVLGKMSNDVKKQLDVTTRKKGNKVLGTTTTTFGNVTATVYESNRFDLGFEIEPSKVSHVQSQNRGSGVKEYSSKSNTFSLDGVDLSTTKEIPTTSYETYSDYDTYDDVPTVNVDDLDY